MFPKNRNNPSIIVFRQMEIASKVSTENRDQGIESSAPLSMANTIKDTIKSRKIAILTADGTDGTQVDKMKKALMAAGAVVEVIAPKLGEVSTVKGVAIPVDKTPDDRIFCFIRCGVYSGRIKSHCSSGAKTGCGRFYFTGL